MDALVDWWPADAALTRIVDLGAGAGSNLRYLAPRLPFAQSWALVDHDDELLARAAREADAGGPVTTFCRSLAVDDPGALARALPEVPSDQPSLITGSALLDLVSDSWIRELAHAVSERRAAALFALSYDGRIAWGDSDPGDELVRAAVNAHQRGDKGFGPALGPAAGTALAEALETVGYRVQTAPSPWTLGPDDRELVQQLVNGWSAAAAEQQPDDADAIASWHARRTARIAEGAFTVEVGHVDVLALPPA